LPLPEQAAPPRSPCGRLEEPRRLQVPSKGVDRFVDRESGNIGRDLEQNVAGLAEVDRAEIVAFLLVDSDDVELWQFNARSKQMFKK
jgi:hypothetical protein